MATSLRIATFNLENLDDKPGAQPTLAARAAVMRPQLERLRADVLCLQEVHGQEQPGQPRRLLALAELLRDTPYATYNMASTMTANNEVYDVRNLVVLSRFPIAETRQIKHDLVAEPKYRRVTASPVEDTAKDVDWERPFFYARLNLPGGRNLHLINVHMKSKLPSTIPGQKVNQYTWKSVSGWAEGYFISSMKRVGQAIEVRMFIDEIFDNAAANEKPLICVCGDFNADPDSVPVMGIRGRVEETGNPELAGRVMVPCENTIPLPARYSLLYLGKGEMIDHLLASRELMRYYRGAEIHNEALADESGAFRTDVLFPESDHAPVLADFELS